MMLGKAKKGNGELWEIRRRGRGEGGQEVRDERETE